MAKLSANGRKELARVTKQVTTPETEGCYCKGEDKECLGCKGTNVKPSLTVWSRTTLALMDDGKVLIKADCLFRGGHDPKPYSYGWKLKGKAKPGMTPERFAEIYKKAGFSQVK